MTKAFQGKFIPKHPEKYLGNPGEIFFRSSWELAVMKKFDLHPSVLKWGSEELAIPYIKPTDGRVHRYFPDFLIVYKDADGNVVKEVIEVKPLKESVINNKSPPRDIAAYVVNQAKWAAAEAFCKQHGLGFRVLTEGSIFKMDKPKRTRKKK